jgi:hypothetical protein
MAPRNVCALSINGWSPPTEPYHVNYCHSTTVYVGLTGSMGGLPDLLCKAEHILLKDRYPCRLSGWSLSPRAFVSIHGNISNPGPGKRLPTGSLQSNHQKDKRDNGSD